MESVSSRGKGCPPPDHYIPSHPIIILSHEECPGRKKKTDKEPIAFSSMGEKENDCDLSKKNKGKYDDDKR